MPVLSYVHPTFKGVWRSSAYFVQLRVMHTTSVHGNLYRAHAVCGMSTNGCAIPSTLKSVNLSTGSQRRCETMPLVEAETLIEARIVYPAPSYPLSSPHSPGFIPRLT